MSGKRSRPLAEIRKNMSDEQLRIISRRDLLRGVGVAAVAAAAPAAPVLLSGAGAPTADAAAAQGATNAVRAREAYENLTATEADTLEAIVARLIPTDANGPGATEARAVHYIDRALGGALASSRQAYSAGFAAFDRYCRMTRGAPFIELSTTDQDSVLIDVESGSATGSGAGFVGSSAQFFGMVLNHTRQGTFGDPYYGGNANYVGWDLIGYPGVRTTVSAADQQLMEKGALKPNHRSAYDSDMFNKATARNGHGEHHHGD
jgi:gluconate 2-dehydrogenase gamma chain